MRTHRYRIIVSARLGKIYWKAFEDLEIQLSGAYTTLTGNLDQAGLHGVLARVLALNLELVGITRLPPLDANYQT